MEMDYKAAAMASLAQIATDVEMDPAVRVQAAGTILSWVNAMPPPYFYPEPPDGNDPPGEWAEVTMDAPDKKPDAA